MTMTYRFKSGSHLSGDAVAVGQRLRALEDRYGELTPEVVEQDARAKKSPLHDLFTWDDTVAAYRYRLTQAAHVIRCVVVVDEPEAPDPHVAFVRVDLADEAGDEDTEPGPTRSAYRSTAVVMSDEQLRAQVLARAFQELAAFKRKYRDLSELAEVFAAIDRATTLEEALV